MSISVKESVPLAPYTIYKIGGPARFFVEVKNIEELKEALKFAVAKGIPFFVLGAGSNILVSDKGFDGLVVRTVCGGLKVEDSRLMVDADVMMAQAVLASAKAGLTGFEWAIGVPGTIGGSVRGNAGCFGGEMKDAVESVGFVDASYLGKSDFPRKFDFDELKNRECEFSYRDSVFKRHPEWIILSATLKLEKGDPKEIQEKIKKITEERSKKQDIGTKSCGCIFKNVSWERKDINKDKLLQEFPELTTFKERFNIPASFLIDRAGLKGKCFGKICISPKHANFFINEGRQAPLGEPRPEGAGGATAEEVVMAVVAAKDAVKNKYGILLEEEIQYVGF